MMDKGHEETQAWRDDWRAQWETQNALLERIATGMEGEGVMTALDDLQAAVTSGSEVATRVAALVDTLQDQVAQLQVSIDELVAAGNPDLGPITEQVNAIRDQLVAAEAPNEPEVTPEG
jgi:hypothetical protein